MIVVSDTSPLNYLVLIGAVDVLPQLFGSVFAPPAVIVEMEHAGTPEIVKLWIASRPSWLKIRAPSGNYSLDPKLDPGEAEAIALAVELQADAILVDEKCGRRIAASQGLTTLGTLTILELAAEKDLLDLPLSLEALQATSFHLTPALVAAALARHIAREQIEKGNVE